MKKLTIVLMILWCVSFGSAQAHHRSHHHHQQTQISQFHQTGVASWYRMGRITADGERFNPNAMTCAHRTLPMGSIVKVTDLHTGHAIVLRVNDRGPYSHHRIIDLSHGAAKRLGVYGVARVRVDLLHRPVIEVAAARN